jgi:hypothetical protein
MRITAMMGIGLRATPIARGRTAPMASLMVSLPCHGEMHASSS